MEAKKQLSDAQKMMLVLAILFAVGVPTWIAAAKGNLWPTILLFVSSQGFFIWRRIKSKR